MKIFNFVALLLLALFATLALAEAEILTQETSTDTATSPDATVASSPSHASSKDATVHVFTSVGDEESPASKTDTASSTPFEDPPSTPRKSVRAPKQPKRSKTSPRITKKSKGSKKRSPAPKKKSAPKKRVIKTVTRRVVKRVVKRGGKRFVQKRVVKKVVKRVVGPKRKGGRSSRSGKAPSRKTKKTSGRGKTFNRFFDDIPPASSGGKWVVCVKGDKQSFGLTSGRKPDGITVYANGRCVVKEYAGGFDGYFSINAGDGHEDGLARAVKAMLRDKAAVIGKGNRKNPRNKRVNAFLVEMRSRSRPINLDYPRDARRADGGERMRNIRKVSAACTKMIQVKRC